MFNLHSFEKILVNMFAFYISSQTHGHLYLNNKYDTQGSRVRVWVKARARARATLCSHPWSHLDDTKLNSHHCPHNLHD